MCAKALAQGRLNLSLPVPTGPGHKVQLLNVQAFIQDGDYGVQVVLQAGQGLVFALARAREQTFSDIAYLLTCNCIAVCWMNNKHRKTLAAIFSDPVKPNIAWDDIEALFLACGGVVEEGRGHGSGS